MGPPPFSVILCVFFFIIILFLSKRRRESHKRLPPGPPKLPLIGNLHQLISSLGPHHAITNLSKKYGPVMSLRLGELFAVVISSAEAVEEALKTNDLSFAGRPQLLIVPITSYGSSIVFAPYGDYWKKMRKICVTELLSTKRVQTFRSVREEEVWNLIEDASKSEGVAINLSEKLFSVTHNIISLTAFSKRCQNTGELMSILDEIISRLSAGFSLADLYPSRKFLRYATGIQPALEKLHKRLDKILDDIVKEHKLKRKNETEREDLIDVFLKCQQSDQLNTPLTEDNIKGATLDILAGGSDTSSTTMEWIMAELVKNPRIMKKAQAEVRQALNGKTKVEEKDIENLNYLKSIVKETLRFHPPAPLIPKETMYNTEIGGYQIPAQAKIFLNAWAISRDPNIWEEPHSFKPERFLSSSIDFRGGHFEFIPFGGGRRICPGISYAVAQIELVVAQLLYHFDWSLPDGVKPEELDMSERSGMTVRKKLFLHLVPKIHIPFTK